jgi:hypothetical protein
VKEVTSRKTEVRRTEDRSLKSEDRSQKVRSQISRSIVTGWYPEARAPRTSGSTICTSTLLTRSADLSATRATPMASEPSCARRYGRWRPSTGPAARYSFRSPGRSRRPRHAPSSRSRPIAKLLQQKPWLLLAVLPRANDQEPRAAFCKGIPLAHRQVAENKVSKDAEIAGHKRMGFPRSQGDRRVARPKRPPGKT